MKVFILIINIIVMFQISILPVNSVFASNCLSPYSSFSEEDIDSLRKEFFNGIRNRGQFIKLPPELFPQIKSINENDYSIHLSFIGNKDSYFNSEFEWFILLNNKTNKIALINQNSYEIIQTDIDLKNFIDIKFDLVNPVDRVPKMTIGFLGGAFFFSLLSKLSLLYESLSSFDINSTFAISMVLSFSCGALMIAIQNGHGNIFREISLFIGSLALFSMFSGIATLFLPFLVIISIAFMVQSLNADLLLKISSNILNIGLFVALLMESIYIIPLFFVASLVLLVIAKKHIKEIVSFRGSKKKLTALLLTGLAFLTLFVLSAKLLLVPIGLAVAGLFYIFIPEKDEEFYNALYKSMYDYFFNDYKKKKMSSYKKKIFDNFSIVYKNFINSIFLILYSNPNNYTNSISKAA